MANEFSQDKKIQLPLMLMTGAAILFLVLSPLWVANRSRASGTSADGSYVVLARHADAPGRGEPDGFDLNDCSTQRSLSDKGRNEARDLGAKFRARAVNVTMVLTSRWCRAQETAKLMKLGPIETDAVFDDLSFSKRHADELLDGERKLIASWRGPGVLLIVSHSSNIKALTGIDLEMGAMVVVSLNQGQVLASPFSVSAEPATLRR
jgi:phosphohistidine phosphatase SixA